jgi:hypothetical protein
LFGKITLREIASPVVQPDSEFGIASGVHELDVDVAALDSFLKKLTGACGPERDLYGVITLSQELHEIVSRVLGLLRSLLLNLRVFPLKLGPPLLKLLQRLSKAEWTHIRPNFFDEFQAFRLRSLFTDKSPPRRRLSLEVRPNRVLLFVVHHDLKHPAILKILRIHDLAP